MANWWQKLYGVISTTFRIGLAKPAVLDASGLTASRTYTFPNLTGKVLVSESVGAALAINSLNGGGVLFNDSASRVKDVSAFTYDEATGRLTAASFGGSGAALTSLDPTQLSAAVPLNKGGTAQTTALAARGGSGLNVESGTGHGDSAYTILATDRFVYTNAAFTASRTWTLPAANAVNAGGQIVVADLQGTLTASNTLVVARAGADTINGGTSVTINEARGYLVLVSDGTSKWQARLLQGANSGTNTGDVTLTGQNYLTISGQQITMGQINLAGTHVTGILGSANGGTGNGFTKFSGPASSERTFTLPNASDTIVCLGVAGTFTAAQTFPNASGIKIQDTDASHTLGLVGGSNLTANRTLTLTTGDASRTVTLSGDPTLVAGTMVPTTVTVSAGGIATGGGDLSANRTITVTAAVQSDQETGTSTSVAVVPGVQHYHPSAAKAWVTFTVSGGVVTVKNSYNVSSVTRNGAGDYTVNFTTAFSGADAYTMVGTASIDVGGTVVLGVLYQGTSPAPAAGSCRLVTANFSTGGVADAKRVSVVFFGDL